MNKIKRNFLALAIIVENQVVLEGNVKRKIKTVPICLMLGLLWDPNSLDCALRAEKGIPGLPTADRLFVRGGTPLQGNGSGGQPQAPTTTGASTTQAAPLNDQPVPPTFRLRRGCPIEVCTAQGTRLLPGDPPSRVPTGVSAPIPPASVGLLGCSSLASKGLPFIRVLLTPIMRENSNDNVLVCPLDS